MPSIRLDWSPYSRGRLTKFHGPRRRTELWRPGERRICGRYGVLRSS